MWLDKRERQEIPMKDEIRLIFDILTYNQGLVQFADGKANGLLLINSIFIASVAPFIEVFRRGSLGVGLVLILGFFFLSVTSILLSLGVIMTRKVSEIEDRNKSLLFYGHIIESNSPEGYIHEFSNAEAGKFRESLLINVFVVARIAARKYGMYNHAQTFTLLSCLSWIMTIAYVLLAK